MKVGGVAMISGRIVHLIEVSYEQVIDRTIAQIHRETGMVQVGKMLEQQLREWGTELAHNLGYWLSPGNAKDLAIRYELLGRQCFDQNLPLHEAVRGLTALREKMMDIAEESMLSNSSMELYAEEELDRRLGRLFDRLLVHLVRGFEQSIPGRGTPHVIH
jgi:hypothetical protein